MKTVYIVAGSLAVLAVIYVIANLPEPQAATGSDTVEGAARRTSAWGSKQRIGSAGDSLSGKLKEGIGKLTGDDDLAARGTGDQVAGQVRDAIGNVAQAAGETLHDLNR